MKSQLSTGHKELDDILAKNEILDQEDQNKEAIKKFISDNIDNEKQGINEKECLIQRAIQSEIDAGIPLHRRTKFWYISCPCKKCRPFTL